MRDILQDGKFTNMRKRRTIYHNDARHYYLWLYDPPMRMKDAWRPIDDVAGTAVDTFSYCVQRGDGLFYPSKVGLMFGSDKQPFTNPIAWHAWHAMHSLMDRGLDPLQVLIDRAHDKGMDFWSDLRLATYGGIDPGLRIENGGGYFAESEVRDHLAGVARELVLDYPSDGLELDFTIANGNRPSYLRPDDVEEYTPTITNWIADLANMVRGRDNGGTIGARVYPTEEINLRQGLDVRTWLADGIVDFVVPMMYEYNRLDPNMPMDWLIEAAHEQDVSVYGLLQHTVPAQVTSLSSDSRVYPTIEQLRATAASYWSRGVDGLYSWFMRWPHGETERTFFSEMGDPDLIEEKNKTYFVLRRSQELDSPSYGAPLPVDIPKAAPDASYEISLYIADDVANNDRVSSATLSVKIMNLIMGDALTILLNGQSILGEPVTRDFAHNTPHIAPRGLDLQYHLREVLPRQGWNTIQITLDERPDLMVGGVTVDQVELRVEYTLYPSVR